MRLIKCTLYLMCAGVVGFFMGRLFSLCRLKPDKGLFRCFDFEKNGMLYEKLNIRKWQAKVPDMSKILPFLMPPKNLTGNYEQRLPTMIHETSKTGTGYRSSPYPSFGNVRQYGLRSLRKADKTTVQANGS